MGENTSLITQGQVLNRRIVKIEVVQNQVQDYDFKLDEAHTLISIQRHEFIDDQREKSLNLPTNQMVGPSETESQQQQQLQKVKVVLDTWKKKYNRGSLRVVSIKRLEKKGNKQMKNIE